MLLFEANSLILAEMNNSNMNNAVFIFETKERKKKNQLLSVEQFID